MRCPRSQAAAHALLAGLLVPGAVVVAVLVSVPAFYVVLAIASLAPGPTSVEDGVFLVLFTTLMAVTVLALWALARRSMRRSLRLANLARANVGGNAVPAPA